jgi:hypothetical protein
MSAVLRHLLCAVLLAALGAVSLRAARIERELADVAERHAGLQFAGGDAALARAERFFGHLANVLPPARHSLREVRLARATALYWRRDYAALLQGAADPLAGLSADEIGLQAIVANAVYRHASVGASELPARLKAIDAGIAAQLTVLRNGQGEEDVAFNYEYLSRLRGALTALKAMPRDGDATGEVKTTHGQPGGEPQPMQPRQFKIHTPLESKEFQDQKSGEQAGKTIERQRRG